MLFRREAKRGEEEEEHSSTKQKREKLSWSYGDRTKTKKSVCSRA